MSPEDYVRRVRPDGTASYLELNAKTPALSSRERGWEGVVVERDRFFPFDNGEVVYDEHFLAYFLDHGVPLAFGCDGRRHAGLYGPGDIILSPGGRPVHWTLDDEADFLVVSIRSEVMTRAIGETMRGDPAKACLIGQPRLHDPLIRQIGLTLLAELEGPGIGERLYVDSLLNTLTLHLVRHYSSAGGRPKIQPDRGLPRAKLRRAIDAINDHLEEGVSLAELAEAAGVSVSHFEALFKRSTGASPHQYLLRCRVERAKELLRREDLSLTQVAARAGFCDQGHLTRHFKRIVGMTPGRYRQGS